jgi:hypothetical protein
VEAAGLAGAPEQFQLALLVALRSSSFGPLCKRCADCPPTNMAELAAHVRDTIALYRRAATDVFSRIGPPTRLILEPAQAVTRIPVSGFTGLEAGWRRLSELPWLDRFVAYLIVRDMTATPFLAMAPDAESWAYPGPGARNGLTRCGVSADLAGLLEARDALDGAVAPWVFDIHDTQHLLCEYHRWARATEGGRKPRVRYQPAA